MNLFDLTLQFKGFPIKEARKRIAETNAISESDFSIFTEQLKSEIVGYHLRENTFYKKFAATVNISSWEDIPILKKEHIQIPLEERVSNGFSKKNTYQGRTSGSSGTPLVYAKDHFCHAMTWAHIMDRFGWYGIDFNTSYQARFYGIPLDTKGYYKERIKDTLANRHRFSIFDLSDTKLEAFLNTFRRKKFDYINGHTSSIVLFSKFLQQKGIILTSVCPTLRTCVVTSEMLFEDDKKLMEQQLGVPVINEYGASELDLIAFTNKEGNLQLNNQTVFVEIVDSNGNVVPHGQTGHIVVTSFYNKAHPFIRYDIGDLGTIDPSSTSKKPILKGLEGRANDMAHLANGKTVPGHTFYYVTKTALGSDSLVKEFVITQNDVETFTISYVSERELIASEIKSLEVALQLYLKTSVKLKHKKVDSLDRSTNGKLKQFVSLLK
ncbi:phenylacetate--CoA ligase family protein [Jejudonia soesokkakensis]|uniref:Phenylacetate--CoA ligase family protein n=1 Tax=Jejudonia soesokkakensis TaxID=1323432 RepID=A0ABW2MPQ9_9FLAO